MIRQIILAFQFLTIIPITRSGSQYRQTDFARSSAYFVIVGMSQGLLLVFTAYLAGKVFHPEAVIGLTLLVYILSNGGFHLDGLADTFDALAAKPEEDRELDRQKRLAIMKDSSTGPIGVIAIVFSVLLKYLLLRNISYFSSFTFYSSLFFLPVIPKWSMVTAMLMGTPARDYGLGRLIMGELRLRDLIFSTLFLLIIAIMPAFFLSRSIIEYHFLFYIILLIAMYFLCKIWIYFCRKKFGGLTGDTMGALSEISEIIFLFMVIAWSQLYI